MSAKNRYLALFSVILICTGAAILRKDSSIDHATKGRSLPAVTGMSISKTSVETILKSIGTAVSNESVDIMSNVTQKVVSIHFSDCEYVKKGQLLVQLNVDKKNAEKKQAEINLTEQQRELNRLEILKNKKVISHKEYDIQKTKMLDAQAKLDAIDADINESSIVAPFDGVLGIRKISIGALLIPGSVVTTIDDINELKVDFTLPEKYSLLLKPGLKIIVKNDALPEEKFEGIISAIVPRVSAVSRSISVRGIINNKDYLLKPGMMLKISIKLKDRESIQIPEKALASIGEKHYVFVLDESQSPAKVKRKYVSIGERENGNIEIERGLEVGEKIVVDGLHKLSDEDSVLIVENEK
ncbi:MAG: efflux RND transporter periplasmic adaptor subunit [Holosporaceae bacterium]|nr:efflux RND transporter periplasmic adaptor subunit [Holosporaceae bacterium]